MRRKLFGYSLIEMIVLAVVITVFFGVIFGGIGGCMSVFQSEPGNSPWAQSWARRWGSSYSINLKPGERLITIVWHGDELWHLSRPFEPGEYPRSYKFEEKSRWGIIQGVVTVNEVASTPLTKPSDNQGR